MQRLLLSSAFVLSSLFCFGQVTSDFSASADGWTVFDNSAGSSSSPVYNSTGGNPGGYISFTTSVGYLPIYWTAPAKFLADQSAAYNKTLTFDLLQSTTGTDNTQNDVMLVGGGWTLVYQLPTKPGTSWTSYTISLNEAQWHNGCATCSAPSQTQMKQALANITKFQIRLKYLSGNTFPYTAQLDNVVLNKIVFGSAPTVTSFTPAAALPGSSVTITGTNFNSTITQNQVYIKGIKATVTNATSTQLVVKVPTSAMYGSITAVNLATGLQGTSTQSFTPLFDNNKDFGGRIIPSSMSRGYNTILPVGTSASNNFGTMDKGDLDGDGWVDLVSTETSTAKIYSFRNLATGGFVNTTSFGPSTALPSLSSIPGGGPYLAETLIVDVDSDGKLDVAASTANNSQGFLAVYRNISTVGSIAFAAPVFFAYNYYNPLYMAAGDLDGDGRTDFVFATGTSPGNVFISQNLSTPGNIDFGFGSSISTTTTSGYSDIVIGDLTGDGKPEIVSPGYNATTLSIYQNNSTPGTISMGTPFTIPAAVSYTVQLAMADFDADNKLDMAWSVYGSQYVYFTKNLYAGGVFDATSFGSTIQITNKLANPLGIAVGDINADSKPDVVMSGYSDLAILENVGTAGNLNASSFNQTTLFQGSATSANVFGQTPIVADLDGDNKPEAAFVSSSGAGIYVFHNESYPVPTVSSISPTSGNAGATVSLNGDLMFTGNTSPSIRLNKIASSISGSPTNTLTSVTAPVGAESGKFNVTNHGLSSTSSYFKKNFSTNRTISTTSFGPSIDFALANLPIALDVADFDDDGKIDVVTGDNSFVTKIFQNSSTAGQSITSSSLALQSTTYNGYANVSTFDVDGDGKVDLNSYGLYQNSSIQGSISFLGGANGVYSTTASYNFAATADFNKDGKIDMAITNSSNSVQVFENLSSRGVFENNALLSTFSTSAVNLTRPPTISSGGIVAEDFDGDGYEDIIVTNKGTDNLTYYLNSKVNNVITTSSFSLLGNYSTSGSQPIGITANDFDGDGKIDIAVTYFNSAFVSVYRNNSSPGDINFATPVDVPVANKGYNIASQDLDGDGKSEIIIIHQPSPGPGSFSIAQNKSTSGAISFNTAINYPLSSPARNPQALAIADINSDQKPDILIVGSPSSTGTNALMIFENKIASSSINITQQPANASVCTGSPATFTTAATGTTNITYQWQYSPDGIVPFANIAVGNGYSGVNTSTLSIDTNGSFGAGHYRSKVDGDFAATVYTNDVTLTLNSTPSAPITTGFTTCSASSVALTATGGTTYAWYTTASGGTAINGVTSGTYNTPVLTSTTTYYVAITNGTCESTRTAVTATINSPAAPTVTGTSGCSPAAVTLTAAGSTNGNYKWYSVSSGGTAISGEVNSTFTTPVLTTTTTYYVSLINGSCESARTAVIATINTLPIAPIATGTSGCTSTSITLTATGGTNGQYRWYTAPTGGTAISGQVNSTFTTPALTATTIYYVSVNNGTCESARASVTATVQVCNQPPVIAPITVQAPIEGKVTVSLSALLSDPDNNLDLSTLKVIVQPLSGASASIDAQRNLILDYTDISFSGTEKLTIQVCDLLGACTQKELSIDVVGDVVVYNGISPNNDGKNDALVIQYIDVLEDTKQNHVYIYNRWGDLVFDVVDYDNKTHIFKGLNNNGNEIASGTYFYKIQYASGKSTQTGYLELKR